MSDAQPTELARTVASELYDAWLEAIREGEGRSFGRWILDNYVLDLGRVSPDE